MGELNKWAKLSRARKSEQSKETLQNFKLETFLDSDQTDLPGNEQSNDKEEEADSEELETQCTRQKHAASLWKNIYLPACLQMQDQETGT